MARLCVIIFFCGDVPVKKQWQLIAIAFFFGGVKV
jgi:hypothetical protein